MNFDNFSDWPKEGYAKLAAELAKLDDRPSTGVKQSVSLDPATIVQAWWREQSMGFKRQAALRTSGRHGRLVQTMLAATDEDLELNVPKQHRRYAKRLSVAEARNATVDAWFNRLLVWVQIVVAICFPLAAIGATLSRAQLHQRLWSEPQALAILASGTIVAGIPLLALILGSNRLVFAIFRRDGSKVPEEFGPAAPTFEESGGHLLEVWQSLALVLGGLVAAAVFGGLTGLFPDPDSTLRRVLVLSKEIFGMGVLGAALGGLVYMDARLLTMTALLVWDSGQADERFADRVVGLLLKVEMQLHAPNSRFGDRVFRDEVAKDAVGLAKFLERTFGVYPAMAKNLRGAAQELRRPHLSTPDKVHDLLERIAGAWLKGHQGHLDDELAASPPVFTTKLSSGLSLDSAFKAAWPFLVGGAKAVARGAATMASMGGVLLLAVYVVLPQLNLEIGDANELLTLIIGLQGLLPLLLGRTNHRRQAANGSTSAED
ncbi:hypothetical protein [Gloeobacter morelensis]|uniref:hypothetical protein n=1 Tax=Gloeobacter morelensis TaxID=2907343 RepID=UPI001E465E61|nr:hypothetical protein [Gloeobacter morelensis]UFP97163.1 hypothetical protein ISF26_23875 [Gloeobacter morelensis MG652769]